MLIVIKINDNKVMYDLYNFKVCKSEIINVCRLAIIR